MDEAHVVGLAGEELDVALGRIHQGIVLGNGRLGNHVTAGSQLLGRRNTGVVGRDVGDLSAHTLLVDLVHDVRHVGQGVAQLIIRVNHEAGELGVRENLMPGLVILHSDLAQLGLGHVLIGSIQLTDGVLTSGKNLGAGEAGLVSGHQSHGHTLLIAHLEHGAEQGLLRLAVALLDKNRAMLGSGQQRVAGLVTLDHDGLGSDFHGIAVGTGGVLNRVRTGLQVLEDDLAVHISRTAADFLALLVDQGHDAALNGNPGALHHGLDRDERLGPVDKLGLGNLAGGHSDSLGGAVGHIAVGNLGLLDQVLAGFQVTRSHGTVGTRGHVADIVAVHPGNPEAGAGQRLAVFIQAADEQTALLSASQIQGLVGAALNVNADRRRVHHVAVGANDGSSIMAVLQASELGRTGLVGGQGVSRAGDNLVLVVTQRNRGAGQGLAGDGIIHRHGPGAQRRVVAGHAETFAVSSQREGLNDEVILITGNGRTDLLENILTGLQGHGADVHAVGVRHSLRTRHSRTISPGDNETGTLERSTGHLVQQQAAGSRPRGISENTGCGIAVAANDDVHRLGQVGEPGRRRQLTDDVLALGKGRNQDAAVRTGLSGIHTGLTRTAVGHLVCSAGNRGTVLGTNPHNQDAAAHLGLEDGSGHVLAAGGFLQDNNLGLGVLDVGVGSAHLGQPVRAGGQVLPGDAVGALDHLGTQVRVAARRDVLQLELDAGQRIQRVRVLRVRRNPVVLGCVITRLAAQRERGRLNHAQGHDQYEQKAYPPLYFSHLTNPPCLPYCHARLPEREKAKSLCSGFRTFAAFPYAI